MRFNAKSSLTSGVCATFDVGTFSLYMNNVACYGAWGGALVSFGSTDPYVTPWTGVGDILVSGFIFDGSYATGLLNYWMPDKSSIVRKVTWDDVTVIRGKPVAFDSCYARIRSMTGFPAFCAQRIQANLTDIWFKNFRGSIGKPPTDPNWGRPNNISTVETHFANWVDKTEPISKH